MKLDSMQEVEYFVNLAKDSALGDIVRAIAMSGTNLNYPITGDSHRDTLVTIRCLQGLQGLQEGLQEQRGGQGKASSPLLSFATIPALKGQHSTHYYSPHSPHPSECPGGYQGCHQPCQKQQYPHQYPLLRPQQGTQVTPGGRQRDFSAFPFPPLTQGLMQDQDLVQDVQDLVQAQAVRENVQENLSSSSRLAQENGHNLPITAQIVQSSSPAPAATTLRSAISSLSGRGAEDVQKNQQIQRIWTILLDLILLILLCVLGVKAGFWAKDKIPLDLLRQPQSEQEILPPPPPPTDAPDAPAPTDVPGVG